MTNAANKKARIAGMGIALRNNLNGVIIYLQNGLFEMCAGKSLKSYFFLFLLCQGCINETVTKATQEKQLDRILSAAESNRENCYKLVGTIPNLNVLNSEYYGKVYVRTYFNMSKQIFENFSVVRSTLKLKLDDSIYSTYDSDAKIPEPEIYNEIIEDKNRIHDSELSFGWVSDDSTCFNNNWIILPVIIK